MKIGEIASIVTGSAFLYATLFVLSSSLYFNVNLFLFFSAEDYLKQFLVWLIPVIAVVGVYIGSLTFSIALDPSPPMQFKKRGVGYYVWKHAIGPVLLVVALVITLNTDKGADLQTFVLWAMGGAIFMADSLTWLPDKLTIPFPTEAHRRSTLLVLSLAIISFMYGFYNSSDLRRQQRSPASQNSVITSSGTYRGIILFALTDYLLLLPEKEGVMQVLPTNTITRIDYAQKYVTSR